MAKVQKLSDTGEPSLETLEWAAQMSGLTVKTIRNKIARREFPFVKLGRRHMVLRDSFWEWVRAQEHKPSYGRH